MGQLTPLIAGKSVAFDTGPLIYYLEEHRNQLLGHVPSTNPPKMRQQSVLARNGRSFEILLKHQH